MSRATASRPRGGLLFGSVILTLLPAAVAAWMMAAAWDHNPQQSYHSAAGIEWGAWLTIGISWFVMLWVPLMMVALGVWFAGRRARAEIEPPAG